MVYGIRYFPNHFDIQQTCKTCLSSFVHKMVDANTQLTGRPASGCSGDVVVKLFACGGRGTGL